jgi:hypothetical protein
MWQWRKYENIIMKMAWHGMAKINENIMEKAKNENGESNNGVAIFMYNNNEIVMKEIIICGVMASWHQRGDVCGISINEMASICMYQSAHVSANNEAKWHGISGMKAYGEMAACNGGMAKYGSVANRNNGISMAK